MRHRTVPAPRLQESGGTITKGSRAPNVTQVAASSWPGPPGSHGRAAAPGIRAAGPRLPTRVAGFVLGDLEMGRAGHAVEQVQVVREHAGGEQRLAQLRQDPRIVVDASQQHRLIQQRAAGRSQPGQRSANAIVDLVCVIGVDDDDLLQSNGGPELDESRVDPLGQHDRQAGVQPHAAQVADGLQVVEQRTEPSVPERQRVAAAQDHLVDAGVAAQCRQCRAEPAARGILVFVGKVAPEAVAAVDRAGAGRHEQGPPRVLVQHARTGS
jgi:hypothetical protein